MRDAEGTFSVHDVLFILPIERAILNERTCRAGITGQRRPDPDGRGVRCLPALLRQRGRTVRPGEDAAGLLAPVPPDPDEETKSAHSQYRATTRGQRHDPRPPRAP